MPFTTHKTKTSGRRRQQVGRAVERHRARGRDLRLSMEAEGVAFYASGMPRVRSPKRKRAGAQSLAAFAQAYLPRVFCMPMSPGQRADLDTMQRAIVHGGRYAFAAPRGDGKTSRVEAAILWAGLYRHRTCIVVVGADLGAALEVVESVKLELRTNETMRADFPIPCWAAALGEDTALKAKAWTWDGKHALMKWAKGGITLPLIDGADGCGCVIVPRGLTGRLRGMRLKVGKRAVRPDLYAIDDPSTDESAASPAQNDTRETLILGAIMGSAGPAASIAAVMPCTIIKYADLAARFLDRKRHPDWQGTTRSMVMSWPEAQDTLWKQYAQLRRTESHEAANEFYRQHQDAMDKGAVVDWPHRYTKGTEMSAIHHAENLLIDLGEDVFSAEYQNDPKERDASVYDLSPELVMSRVDAGRKAGELPADARIVVAASDINHYGIHTVIVAFANDQTAWLIWYGRHSDHGRDIVPKNSTEAETKRLIFEALVAHGAALADVSLRREDAPATINGWVIDAGYQPDMVRRYASGPGRTCGIQVLPARGFAADQYRPTARSIIGRPREQCHMSQSAIAGRFVAWNAHYWREISQRAWLGTPGAPGSISLFDGRNHRDFAEQVTRERLVEKLRGQYGPVWRYHSAPGWHDYGDALSMAYVAAVWAGIGTSGPVPVAPTRKHRPKPKISFVRTR